MQKIMSKPTATIPGDSDGTMSFSLVLYCTETKTIEHKQILVTPPSSGTVVRDIKLQIETEYQIPAHVQTLMHESRALSNDTELRAMYIRSGDALHVTYYSKGNPKEVTAIMNWLDQLLVAMKQQEPSVSTGLSQEIERCLSVGRQRGYVTDLAMEYFEPWLDPTKYVNKLHFAHNGGLDTITAIYAILLRQPWPNCLLLMKYLECHILEIIWSFIETFPLRRLFIQRGGLQMCMKSLLRKVIQKGRPIEDYESPKHERSTRNLTGTIRAALGSLVNMSELPECHMEIATNKEVLRQLLCISFRTAMGVFCAHAAVTILMSVAFTAGTHRYLATPFIVEKLMQACKIRRVFRAAQLLLVSPNYIPLELHQQIHDHMNEFLTTVTYKTVMEGELKRGYVWLTFTPYIKLLYLPDTPQPEMMRNLQLLSQETVIFGLQNMLGRENHREVLVREGLVDYVTCLPSYVPDCLRPRARELVQILVSCGDLHVQPPRLASLVKAELAKAHFGLERVLSMSVGEIVSEILPLE